MDQNFVFTGSKLLWSHLIAIRRVHRLRVFFFIAFKTLRDFASEFHHCVLRAAGHLCAFDHQRLANGQSKIRTFIYLISLALHKFEKFLIKRRTCICSAGLYYFSRRLLIPMAMIISMPASGRFAAHHFHIESTLKWPNDDDAKSIKKTSIFIFCLIWGSCLGDG